MFRTLLIIAAIAVAVLLIRRLLAARPSGEDQPPRVREERDMVRCAHCGLHIPANTAVRAGDRTYCSEEHRRLDQPD
ncbi:MAG: hypothetical protein LPK58_03255 [Gammaproteobacteria bacterium]|nr:hypothetical protein [Gammaproteobacteria bacterium]MDX5374698.1 hypothetical protein [Gammaproteobacteria bacterium]